MERIKGALVVAFLRLFALLPWRAAQAVGSLIGWLMWKLPNRSREVVRINLAQCFPELDEAARERLAAQSLRDIGRTLTESACAWIWPAAKSLQQIRQVEGGELLQQALAEGKGVVLVSSHLGNWELLLQYVCSLCQPIILYRPPKLRAVDELLVRQRTQLGNQLAPSTKEGILNLIKTLRKGGGGRYCRRPRTQPVQWGVRTVFWRANADQQIRTLPGAGAQGYGAIHSCVAPG